MYLEKFNPVFPEREDSFAIEQASNRFISKAKIFQHYVQIFASTMQRKFDYLVYIDLQAGSGLKLVENQIVSGYSAMALGQKIPFSKLIFCDDNVDHCTALRVRVNKYARGRNTAIFQGDPNALVEKLAYYIPESGSRHKVAALCFIDLNTFHLAFDTIRLLAEIGVHFLIMIDFEREDPEAFSTVIEQQREQLNAFLGTPISALESELEVDSNEAFLRALAKVYHNQIRSLGFISKGSFHPVEGHVPFVFTGFYSHTNGVETEEEASNRDALQVSLFN